MLAASVAVATSISFSINASLWVGAVCYLMIGPIGVALASMPRQSKADPGAAVRSFDLAAASPDPLLTR